VSGFGVLRPEPNLGVTAFEVVAEAVMPSGTTNIYFIGDCFRRKTGFVIIGTRDAFFSVRTESRFRPKR